MIIDRHSAVFLHIGKTAGTALEQALHGRLPEPSVADYKLLFGWCDKTNIYLQHATLKSVKRILPPEMWAAYRKFTIVRNPVHRIISVYNYSYWRRGGRKISFSEFLECLPEGMAQETKRGGGHLPLQREFTHLDGDLVVDYVGRFEQLASAVEDISALLELPGPLVLPVRRPRNRQSHDVFISDLTTADIRHIVSCYYDDFQAFNYSTAPEDYALKSDSLPAWDFIDLSFGEAKLRADGPRGVIEELRRYFRYMESSAGAPPTAILRIVKREDGLYRVDSKWDQYPPLNFGELIAAIRTEMMYEYSRIVTRLPYFGSAVTVDGKAVALLGAGLGKSTLATWLCSRGFSLASEGAVDFNGTDLIPMRGPTRLGVEAYRLLASKGIFDAPAVTRSLDHFEIPPQDGAFSQDVPEARIAIFPNYFPGSPATARVVDRSSVAALLLPGEETATQELFSPLPAGLQLIDLIYGSLEQLEGILDQVLLHSLRQDLDAEAICRLLNGVSYRLPNAEGRRRFESPAATVRPMKCRLTIGMATYDDYDGVYFSIQALRLYHAEVMKDAEILVIDNNPSGPCGQPLKALEAAIPNYRYLPWSEASGTAVRDRIFAEAQGEFVLCIDCHVFLPPGALNSLMAFLERNPDISDLLQGPLINDDLSTLNTHMRPEWRNGFYGIWDFDSRGADAEGEPFDIPMQGLGLFVCRRDAWPGFNPRFRGFGGEEGYIHEKFRMRGNRTMCLPFLRWLHRFGRPLGVPYPNNWWDRIRNYLIGFHEVGLPLGDLKAHMEEMVGKDLLERACEEFERELGRAAIADR